MIKIINQKIKMCCINFLIDKMFVVTENGKKYNDEY